MRQYRPDLVHLHGIDFLQYLPPAGVPAVVTLHLPPSWYPPAILSLERQETWLHCVSSAQRRDCPEADNLLPTIENGVPPVASFHPIRRRGFAVTMGRICPEKGTDTALRAARLARVPILVAGQVFSYEAHLRYFEEQVKPLLRRPWFNKLSPGAILLAHAIERARQEGATHVDFLRGAEPYKYLWGAEDRINYAVRPGTNNSESRGPQGS